MYWRNGHERLIDQCQKVQKITFHINKYKINSGVHIVVGTPGRLSDLINKKKFNLDLCKFLTLDEANRLLDVAFEDEIRNILDHFKV